MNAALPQSVLRIVSDNTHTATVSPYDFDMVCGYEYDPGEPAIFWPTDLAHPGSPPEVQLLSCFVGGVNIFDMLSNAQITRIEDCIVTQLEA